MDRFCIIVFKNSVQNLAKFLCTLSDYMLSAVKCQRILEELLNVELQTCLSSVIVVF